ncbi:MAG: pyrroline-5-carboxylate reductase [Motiliproteus sp.]|jgi:pyrroline-5-carboxylate reductase
MKDKEYPVLAFIGAGNMAQAIMGGLLAQGYPADRIWGTGRDQARLDELGQRLGIRTSTDNNQAVAAAEVLILAVKPQMMQAVARTLAEEVQHSRPLVISVAAGIPCASLEGWLGGDVALVRCMPNTPSLVQTGASGLYANAQVSQRQREQTELLLAAVGIAEWVDSEALIDTVAAVSGSGPAYYFMLMEAMIDAGEAQGLSRETSARLTLQTALGAAKMALASDVGPAELRRRVTSPKGCTEQAVLCFERGDLSGLVAEAMKVNAERGRAMAAELGND